MPVDDPDTALLCWGPWALHPAARQLRRSGQPVSLGGRAFDLLLALAEARGHTVSKAALMDRVWPGIDVEENNLAVQVSALRKLLGAAALATVPGRGYQLTLLPDLAADQAGGISSATPSATSGTTPTGRSAGPAADAAASALASGGCRPLPLHPNTLIGRDGDLDALQALLDTRRLVTLVGTAGIGKSSLALAAAHQRALLHPQAVAWIELANVSDAAGLASALCSALRMPAPGGADALPALVAALRPLALLLVIDNAEHLAEPVGKLAAALLAQAPHVRLLVTSQFALRLDGEQRMQLAPLDLPPADASCEAALRCGALALFVDQARSADRRFRLTADNVGQAVALCRQLDGLPLALKLAAARLPLLGLTGLLSGLGDRLKLLAGGPRDAPQRHQTLAAALGWSCALLGPAEQALFYRLGVFAGSFSLAMAAALDQTETSAGAGADDPASALPDTVERLAVLVDRSLVDVVAGDPPRYRLLQSARAHALAARGNARPAAEQRHAQVMRGWAEAVHAASWQRSDAATAAAAVDDLDNLRAALDASARDDPAQCRALWGACAELFVLLGLDHEARRRCPAAPADTADTADDAAHHPAGDPAHAAAEARFWRMRGRLHWNRNNALARSDALRAAAASRRQGDAPGLYQALCLAAAAGGAAQLADSAAQLAEAGQIEQAAWPPRLRLARPWGRIYVCKHQDDSAGALAAAEAAAALALAAGADQSHWQMRSAIASSLLALGRVDAAVAVARATHAGQPGRHGRPYITALGSLYAALLMQGRTAEARPLLGRFLAESRRCDWEVMPRAGDWCALLAAQEGRFEAAARLSGHADAATARRGGRERHERLAHAAVQALLDPVLAPAQRQAWAEAGRTLDEEAVCALTLALA